MGNKGVLATTNSPPCYQELSQNKVQTKKVLNSRTCLQTETVAGRPWLLWLHTCTFRAGLLLFIAIKWEHYEHLQLLGNYIVTGRHGVITSMGLRSQLGLVNVMCGDLILRSAIKLNDLYRTVVRCFSGWRRRMCTEEMRESESEKVSAWAESNVSRFQRSV